jgi:DNA-binding protein YbaB
MTSPSPYEEVSIAAQSSLSDYAAVAQQLAAQEVEGRSLDGRVIVRATGGGTITAVEFKPGTLLRYDSGELSEVVTEAIRETQLRARRDFDAAMTEAIPSAAKEAHRLIAESGPV